jgi:biopolymer transport protein ExbD
MKFSQSRREEPEINLIPLIDVLLMTLIFLLVTTSFSNQSQLRLQLPEAGGPANIEDVSVRVAIDAQGQYFINNRQLLAGTTEQLVQAMGQAAGQRKDPVVVVSADRKTPHEAVIRVMDAARRLGFNHLTFATQQAVDQGPGR